MVHSPAKPSITNSEASKIADKFAVSYIRVSTKAQTKEEKSGIERQEQDYLNWLERNPEYKNLDGYEFRDLGVSGRGKNSKVGALSLFLKAAEKGKIPSGTCLVVESWTRFTRQAARESLKLVNKVFDYGLGIAFIQWGGEVFYGEDSPVWFQIMGAITASSMEWKDKSERQKGYHKKVAKQLAEGDLSHYVSRKGNRGRMYVFWVDFDEKTNEFIEIPEKVKLVQRIFKMGLTMGAKKIAGILRNEGIKNPANGTAKELTEQTIRGILKNRAVFGELTKKDLTVRRYPVIVSVEEFNAVQVATKLRSTFAGNPTANNKVVNLFQGVLFCGACGGRIDVVNKKRDACINKGEKNGLKEEVSYRQMFCHHGRNKTSDCTVRNAIPYTYEHSGVDNELTILKQIQTFRWAEFFTDEKHEQELKVEINKRNNFLKQRNQAKDQIDKYDRAEEKYIDEGEILPKAIREKRKEAEKNYEELDEKYNRAVLDIQNLKRKKTGKQAEKDIQTRVDQFIKKDRFDKNKRSEFNMWLKEIGIAVNVLIGERLRKYPNNYRFEIGIGIYDSKTKKYIGLDQRAEDAYVLGVDVKEVMKQQIAEKNRPILDGKTTVIFSFPDKK